MPPRKGAGRGIVKSGNAGNSSKSSSSVSKKPTTSGVTPDTQDERKSLFPPGSKYPLSLLNERCQKNGWEKPEVIVVRFITPTSKVNAEPNETQQNRHEQGYSFIILIRCHNKKTSKLDTVRFEPHPPFYMPTALEAKHWGATYALYRICNNIQLNRVLPPGPREYWVQLEQEHKAAPEHQKWMYNPDPFAASREVQARQVEVAKRRDESSSSNVSSRNVREKDSLGGDLTGFIEVKMSPTLREVVEDAIKKSYPMSKSLDGQTRFIPSESHDDIRRSLSSLNFTSNQINQTLKALSSPSPLTQSLLDSLPNFLEAAISHLLLSTPESDLPPRFLAQGAGNAFIQTIHTGSEILKDRWISERLVKEAGFPSHIVKRLMQSRKSQISFESMLLELVRPLIAKPALVEINDHFDIEERDLHRQTEIAALGSVYPSVQIIDPATKTNASINTDATIVIPVPDTPIVFHLFLPVDHPYPLTAALPPMYVSDDGSGVLPYIRLHLLSTLLNSPSIQERESGEGVALLATDILQETWNILQTKGNPDLGDVLFPFLGNLDDGQHFPETGQTSGSTVTSSLSTTFQQNQRRPLKRVQDTRTNGQILQEIDRIRLEENFQSLFKERQKLPAWSAKDSFIKLFKANRVVVCVGETGSGKTTQIPQYILDDYIDSVRQNKPEALSLAKVQIMITQPRRVAAMSVASRVSTERGNDGSVSFSIRGESTSTWRTKLLFCTTGVALRQLTAGDGLNNINTIIVDEVHERSVDSDFLLLELRDLLERNKDIKIVLMSATINHDVFLNYFKGAALSIIPGRTHPVQDIYLEDIIPHISYRPPSSKPMQKQKEDELQAFRDTYKSYGLDKASIQALENLTRAGRIDYQLIAATVSFIISNKGDGAILIFLSGALEIKYCIEAIKSSLGTSVEVLPLHANLSADEQKKVFKRSVKKKVVVSTNVAETSITIDDIVYVIDTGKVKEVTYDADSRLSQLAERWVSKAAARQRRGRAGRTRPGECYKLYTRKQEADWDEFAIPEILRTPLESLLLSAKAMRETEDVKLFLNKAIDPPSITAIEKAWATLQELGTVDQNDSLTTLGRLLALLPVDLRLGKMLVLGVIFGCLEPALTIAACLSSKPLFVSPIEKRDEATSARHRFMAMNSDLLSDVHAYDECMKVAASGGDSALRSFCENNFISFTSVKDVTSLRADLSEALYSAGLAINSSDVSLTADFPVLLQTIIMAGVYPGIARVTLPSSAIKFDKLQGGTVQRAQEAREFRIFDLDAGADKGERGERIFLHPSSVLFKRDNWREPFICYFRKAVTTKSYLRDATEVPLYAILLFGGPLAVDQVKGWLTIRRAGGGTRYSMKAWPRIGVLVNQLRHLLDTRLNQALEKETLDTFQRGDPIFDSILALLTKGESNLG